MSGVRAAAPPGAVPGVRRRPRAGARQTLRALARARPLPAGAGGLGGRWPGRHRDRRSRPSGSTFPGVVGLAAGMDKDGVAPHAWAALGFGHAELGTVTAPAQPGNDTATAVPAAGESGAGQPDGLQQRRGRPPWPPGWPRPGVRRGNEPPGSRSASRSARPRSRRWRSGRGLPGVVRRGRAVRRLRRGERLQPEHARAAARCRTQSAPRADRKPRRRGPDRTTRPRPVPVFVKVAPDLPYDALEEVLDVCTEPGVGRPDRDATPRCAARACPRPRAAWPSRPAGCPARR